MALMRYSTRAFKTLRNGTLVIVGAIAIVASLFTAKFFGASDAGNISRNTYLESGIAHADAPGGCSSGDGSYPSAPPQSDAGQGDCCDGCGDSY